MSNLQFECYYEKTCISRKENPARCMKCGNNTKRNYMEDHFIEAKDKPIPDKCPRLTYSGPAEQTAGYQCPVCGEFTNPYQANGKRCKHCGYKLNIS